MHLSFVRSVTMDKWKDIELEKMKVSTMSFNSQIPWDKPWEAEGAFFCVAGWRKSSGKGVL